MQQMNQPPDNAHAAAKSHRALTAFQTREAGLESLNRTVSILRAWAVCPQVFDHISPQDRQNILLNALELAESAQAHLSR